MLEDMMALLIGAIISSSMQYYIWEAGNGRALLNLFFGPQGVLTLNQNRLYLFIGSWILFLWLFNFLKAGGQEAFSGKINGAFALIIALKLASARDPISVDGLAHLGEVIGTIIIGNNLKDRFGEGTKWIAFIGAFLLVDYIVSVVFPGKAWFFDFFNGWSKNH